MQSSVEKLAVQTILQMQCARKGGEEEPQPHYQLRFVFDSFFFVCQRSGHSWTWKRRRCCLLDVKEEIKLRVEFHKRLRRSEEIFALAYSCLIKRQYGFIPIALVSLHHLRRPMCVICHNIRCSTLGDERKKNLHIGIGVESEVQFSQSVPSHTRATSANVIIQGIHEMTRFC